MQQHRIFNLVKRSTVYAISLLLLFSCADGSSSVMICVSPSAHKYHARRCPGVKACTHKIKKLTIEEAEALGKTPCGFCY